MLVKRSTSTKRGRRIKPKQPLGANGYKKSEETRARILGVALKAFGEAPFAAVTTRQIAEGAGVSLPVLQYYFGNKEGVYRACAQTILERYRQRTSGAAAEARKALSEDCSPEAARLQLKALVGALTGLLVGSQESEGWAQFIARELRDPGPVFEMLYENLWRPGVDVTARLIARLRRRSEDDPSVRLQALLLISGVLAFQSGRTIALRAMHWPRFGPEEVAMIRAVLDAQVDAIANDG